MLAQAEPCLSLISVTQDYPCEAYGNCTGLHCQLNDTFPRNASFVVHKCVDPVQVDLNIVTADDTIDFHQQFNDSGMVVYTEAGMSVTVMVMMSRNDTYLDFEV